MKTNNLYLTVACLLTVLLTGCRAVQPILILNPWDMFWMPLVYIGLCWIFAKALSKDKGNFWLWLVLNIILTPMVGVIIIITKLSK